MSEVHATPSTGSGSEASPLTTPLSRSEPTTHRPSCADASMRDEGCRQRSKRHTVATAPRMRITSAPTGAARETQLDSKPSSTAADGTGTPVLCRIRESRLSEERLPRHLSPPWSGSSSSSSRSFSTSRAARTIAPACSSQVSSHMVRSAPPCAPRGLASSIPMTGQSATWPTSIRAAPFLLRQERSPRSCARLDRCPGAPTS